MIATFVLNAREDQRRTQAAMEAEARYQARFLADQVGRAVSSVNRALVVLADRAKAQGMQAFAGAEKRQDLLAIASGLPLEYQLWVFRPDGTPLATSLSDKPPPINVADREYFRRALEASDGHMVIGTPVMTRDDGHEGIPFALRLRDKHGITLGVAMAGVKLSAMVDAYKAFLGEGHNILAIRHVVDGRFLMRLPRSEHPPGKAPPPLFDLRLEEGVATRPSTVDGEVRTFAIRRVAGYPLGAIAGVHTKPWMDRLYGNLLWQACWLALGLVLALVLYVALLRRFKADETYARRLQSADRAKSHFLAAASHDLRQPVQAMRLFWEVLAQSKGPNAEHPAF